MYCLYSLSVVAPTHWNSPLARAGLTILEASRDPDDPPAPTKVWSSSIKTMTSGFLFNSSMIAFILSSNCPLYLVPATIDPMSRLTTLLLSRFLETFLWIILKASPSAIADLPTPGSPIRTGLFFFLLARIWETLSISESLPTIGSNFPLFARSVRSLLKESNAGVFDDVGLDL